MGVFWSFWAPLLLGSVGAVCGALALSMMRRVPPDTAAITSLKKAVAEIDLELIECLDRLDKLTVVAKRKYARDAARSKRTDEPETDSEWKKRMAANYAMNRGGVSNGN